MPLKDLVCGMNDVPENITQIASGLPYRDYRIAGILVKNFCLKNDIPTRTIGNIIPDEWIYVQDRTVKVGRIVLFNNWSPYMVQNPESNVWLGLEYFCNEGDTLWSMSDSEFSALATDEMLKLGLISSLNDVLDSHTERVKKAYPAYFDTYEHIDELRTFLDTIHNLYCIGRNGQHRYNNIDHSMCTAFEAVNCIISGSLDKSPIWNVNTEKQYHESK